MAILKHIASKSSNYGAALEYLIFKHDELRKTPILDQNGNRIMRDEFYLDGLNCEPYSFDAACQQLNREYQKNKNKNEIKSHHYIISFDADYVAGVVDSEDYQLIREDYSRQYDGLRAALQEAENKKVQVEQQIEEYLNMTSHLEEHLDNFEFDIQLVKSLVQKIEVSADKRIRIVFGFRDVFTELGKESAET